MAAEALVLLLGHRLADGVVALVVAPGEVVASLVGQRPVGRLVGEVGEEAALLAQC